MGKEREREGGKEGEGELWGGGVYTCGVFVCTHTAMGLEGDTPDRPQDGAALHPAVPPFSSLYSTCLQ